MKALTSLLVLALVSLCTLSAPLGQTEAGAKHLIHEAPQDSKPADISTARLEKRDDIDVYNENQPENQIPNYGVLK
jgi:hypothetical protein